MARRKRRNGEDTYQLGVKALVRDDRDRIMVIRERGKRYWDLPGGRAKVGEKPYQTLRRELSEEIGARLVGRPRILTTFLSPARLTFRDGREFGLVITVYDVRASDLEPASETDTRIVWARRDEAARLLSSGNKYSSYFLNTFIR